MNKHIVKRTCQYICMVAVLPMTLLSSEKLGIGDFFFYLFSTSLALVPGKIGSYIRVAFYRGVSGKIAWDVNIGFGTFFSKRDIRIGKHVSIGAYCLIGSVNIGDSCQVASRVSIPSGRHQHALPDESKNSIKPHFHQLHIGPKSWIGEAAVILEDVGAQCVVGAGSVVVHPLENGQIVAGNPARLIRK